MDICCDIYNVTQAIQAKRAETGGLHDEQEIYKRVFQSDIRTLPQGFKRNQATDIGRILCQHRLQSEVCYSQNKWSSAWNIFLSTPPSETVYIWDKGGINSDSCLEGSGISLFSPIKESILIMVLSSSTGIWYGIANGNRYNRNELRLFMNLFMPSMKLLKKQRIGSRLKRVYEETKTPFERVVESKQEDPNKIEEMKRLHRISQDL